MEKDISKVLLITDLDGTFLPSTKELSKVDMDALDRFRNAGGKFSIATGRTLQTVQYYLEELRLDIPFILFNGAVIYDMSKNEVVSKKELPDDSRNIAADVLSEFPDAACEILTIDNVFIPQNNETEDRHVKLCRVEPVYESLDKIPAGGWLKVLFAGKPEMMPKLIKYIDSKNYSGVDFVKSADIFYEMVLKDTSKGNALKELIRISGFEDHMVVAAGDYHNDIEMLKFATIGAATANAEQDVKDSADIVLTKTNNEGAISELINYILSGKVEI